MSGGGGHTDNTICSYCDDSDTAIVSDWDLWHTTHGIKYTQYAVDLPTQKSLILCEKAPNIIIVLSILRQA